MDKISRLNLLFAQDEALLRVNTRLRVTAPSQPHVEKPIEKEKDSTEQQIPDEMIISCDKQAPVEASPDSTTRGQPGRPTAIPSSPDPLEHDGSFCPLMGIAKYPYRFVKGQLSQTVASRFFDRGQFWTRCWDV